jgi:K+-sensing histidine kinase KdpD
VVNHLYKQKIEPVTEIDEHLGEADADPQQLEQVLVKLYSISVTDTGFGIEPENVPKIFHPFFTARKKTGLGLGLSICERIVRNHGGRIEVEREPGKGTSFKVHLPLEHDLAQLARGKREVGDGEGLV